MADTLDRDTAARRAFLKTLEDSGQVRRTVTFTAPPPRDVADRCEASAELLTRLRRSLLDEVPGPIGAAVAEDLRGVIVDLVLAAGYLAGLADAEDGQRGGA